MSLTFFNLSVNITTVPNVFEAWTGQELIHVRAERDVLKAQVATLGAQLKAD